MEEAFDVVFRIPTDTALDGVDPILHPEHGGHITTPDGSSNRVVPHRFYFLPSYFFLRVLSKWHMLSVHFSLSLALVHIIVLA